MGPGEADQSSTLFGDLSKILLSKKKKKKKRQNKQKPAVITLGLITSFRPHCCTLRTFCETLSKLEYIPTVEVSVVVGNVLF